MFTTIDFTHDPFYLREDGINIRHHVEIYTNDWWHLNHMSPEDTAYKDIRMCVLSGDVSYGEQSYHDVLNIKVMLNCHGEIEARASGALTTIAPFVP